MQPGTGYRGFAVQGGCLGAMMSGFVKIFCVLMALLAWCGAIWINVRVAQQLRAAGLSVWTFNYRARFDVWKGRNIVLFLIYSAIFATAISLLLVMQ